MAALKGTSVELEEGATYSLLNPDLTVEQCHLILP